MNSAMKILVLAAIAFMVIFVFRKQLGITWFDTPETPEQRAAREAAEAEAARRAALEGGSGGGAGGGGATDGGGGTTPSPVPTGPMGPSIIYPVQGAWAGDSYCLRLFDYDRPADQAIVGPGASRTTWGSSFRRDSVDLVTSWMYQMEDPALPRRSLLSSGSTRILREFTLATDSGSRETDWAAFRPSVTAADHGALVRDDMALWYIMRARAYLTLINIIQQPSTTGRSEIIVPNPYPHLLPDMPLVNTARRLLDQFLGTVVIPQWTDPTEAVRESAFRIIVDNSLRYFCPQQATPYVRTSNYYLAWYPPGVQTGMQAVPWQRLLREAADQLHEWMNRFAGRLEALGPGTNPRSWGFNTNSMTASNTPRGPWRVGLRLATAELLVGTLPPFNESPLMSHVLRSPHTLNPVLGRLDSVFHRLWGIPYSVIRTSLWPMWWELLESDDSFLDSIYHVRTSEARTVNVFRESMLHILLPPFRADPETC